MVFTSLSCSFQENAHLFCAPLLTQHGEADKVTCPDASQRFFSVVSCPENELVFYPDAFHSMYLETAETRDKVMKETGDWIEKVLGNKAWERSEQRLKGRRRWKISVLSQSKAF